MRTEAWVTADSSEKPLQRGRGTVGIYVILVKGEYMQLSACNLQKASVSVLKVSASHEEQWSP